MTGGLRDREGCLCARLFSGWMDGCLINNNDGEIKWKYKSVYFLFYNVANIEKVYSKRFAIALSSFCCHQIHFNIFSLTLSLSLTEAKKKQRPSELDNLVAALDRGGQPAATPTSGKEFDINDFFNFSDPVPVSSFSACSPSPPTPFLL